MAFLPDIKKCQMSDLDYELLSTLTCSHCPSYLSPPIQVCTNGHSLCPACFKKVKPHGRCPQCPGKFMNRRCFILEKIYDKLLRPCKNQKYGCTFIAKGCNIKRHEKKCLWKFLGHQLKNKHVWILCEIKIKANNKSLTKYILGFLHNKILYIKL